MKKPRGRLNGIRMLLSLMLFLDVLTLLSSILVKVSGAVVTEFSVSPEVVYGRQLETRMAQADRRLVPESVKVYVAQPSLWQTILGLFSHGLAAVIASIVMIVMARRLVDLAIKTHPFTPGMAKALRRLGFVILVGGFVAELIRSTAAILLYRSVVPHGTAEYDVDWGISLWWLLLGVVVLAFAQVVEHGCTLRTELDEVI